MSNKTQFKNYRFFITCGYSQRKLEMKRVLSIDGGGIRGIIPGIVLVALEEKIQRATNRPDFLLTDYSIFLRAPVLVVYCCLFCYVPMMKTQQSTSILLKKRWTFTWIMAPKYLRQRLGVGF